MYVSAEPWSFPIHAQPELKGIGRCFQTVKAVRSWQLLNFWNFHLFRFKGQVRVAGKTFPIKPGYASLIPPLVNMEYELESRSEWLYAHFTFPGAHAPDHVELPVMQDMGGAFEHLWKQFEQAIGWFPDRRRRAEVRIWELLWRLSDGRPLVRPAPVRAIKTEGAGLAERVRQSIEQRLGQRLRVARLAQEAGLSHNHLIRLFRKTHGQTVAAYIRRRRMERARHLLLQTTLPIKAIACEVGIADPHLFNKTVRREFGKAPRELRRAAR